MENDNKNQRNMINIAKILKDYPKGTKLWSNVFGECTFDEVVDYGYIYVLCGEIDAYFSKFGEFMEDSGLCNLFPSKEMQDWEKLAWKKGDVLKDGYGIECMFDGWIEDDFTKFHSIYSITTAPTNEQTFYEDQIFSTKEYCKVEVKVQSRFIKNLEEKYGGIFNPETLEIEKPKPTFLSSLERVGKNWNPQTKRIENLPKAHEFKPFQKVLARDSNNGKWQADFFGYYEEDSECSYTCVSAGFRQCIPYEGNEHLLGTTNEWKGGKV